MKKAFKIVISALFVFIITFSFFTPVTTFAQTETETPGGAETNNLTEPVQLQNPLSGINSLPDLVEAILRIVLTIGTPLVALAIIYAGFKFVTAQGNPTKLEEARRTLLYVVIGAGVLLAAYVIAEAIVGTINAIRG